MFFKNIIQHSLRVKKVLFVCLGNICRSPAAEAVFRHMVQSKGWSCDSAGTSVYHEDEPAHPTMIDRAQIRGYNITSLSRSFKKQDFFLFDLIITMDISNYSNILKVAEEKDYEKIWPLMEFCTQHDVEEVPDPYGANSTRFDLVLDILEDGCAGLIQKIEANEI